MAYCAFNGSSTTENKKGTSHAEMIWESEAKNSHENGIQQSVPDYGAQGCAESERGRCAHIKH
jgi:hypothetical protein